MMFDAYELRTEGLTDEQKQERDQLVLEVFALSYLVQTKTEYCVFFELTGHVDWIKIKIAKSKKDYSNELTETKFQVDGRYQRGDKEQPNAYLLRKIDILKKILETGDIPFADMEKRVVQVQQTYFIW